MREGGALEIDEIAARLLRQYWAVVLVCVMVPLAAFGLITAKEPATYQADARIITGSVVPGSSTQSDAIVSQVQAIATGPGTASAALRAAGVQRNLLNFINNDIAVTGLGGSQVVDLAVTDKNPQAAQRIAASLATAVVDALNHAGQGGIINALHAIDGELVTLAQQRAVLAQQLTGHPRDQQIQARLAGLDQVIANFTGDRGRLLIESTAQGLAGIIDRPALPLRPQSRALPQKLGLAGVLGLVAGLLIAALIEVARPTVPGAQRVGRRLSAPVLGRLGAADLRGTVTGTVTSGVTQLAFRTRLAALHAARSTVALADAGTGVDLDALAACLTEALAGDAFHRPEMPDYPVTGNSHGGQKAELADVPPGSPGTAVMTQQATFAGSALRICPMSRMNPAATSEWERVGLLILCGPVTRVSEVASLADLAESSGWPVLGVAAVPHSRRRRRKAARAEGHPQ
jgi:capsular polysaccharide biosynthesis protein